VYRDEDAFSEHRRQPYVQQFERDRTPYVLATNVIELGVRHAKFMPGGTARPGPWGSGAR
jgi:quinol monooxygenase YgiN